MDCKNIDPFIILHPLGFGNSLFLGLGEQDAFLSLSQLSIDFKINSSSIFLAGFSMGGAAALRLLSAFPSRFKGVASIGGYSINPVHWFGPSLEHIKDAYLMAYKDLDILENSSVFNGQNIYLSHGNLDLGVGGGVPFNQFEKIKSVIEKTTCSLKWNVMENIGHAEFPQIERERIIEWFTNLLYFHSTEMNYFPNTINRNTNLSLTKNPIVFVYITQSTISNYQSQLAEAEARFYLELNAGVHCGPFRNGELLWGATSTPDYKIKLNRSEGVNIVLYGSPSDNSIIRSLSPYLPVKESSNGFIINGNNWTWKDYAARFIITNPFSKDSSIVINLGKDYQILSKGFGIWYGLIPSYIVFNSVEICDFGELKLK
jgi:predicted esterase